MEDPEVVPDIPRQQVKPVAPKQLPKPNEVKIPGWPEDAKTAKQRQQSFGQYEKTIDLGDGVKMKMVLIPAGDFVIGDASGEPDEYPLCRVSVERPFWMGTYEVTNQQFKRFSPSHDSGYYSKRHAKRGDDKGLTLSPPFQPVVRVSWDQAVAFCHWLSDTTDMKFTLPSEAQWEYACRAGSGTELFYGGVGADFSPWANVADKSFTISSKTGGLENLLPEGASLSDTRFNDKGIVSVSVGNYQPNLWGLYDMHGNASEWTGTTYKAYPYIADDGRNEAEAVGRKVVRGGSFFDRPARCRSGFRLSYHKWQRVFNVGFRVVCQTAEKRENIVKAPQQGNIGRSF